MSNFGKRKRNIFVNRLHKNKQNAMDNLKYNVFISYSRNDYLDENGNVRADREVANILGTIKQPNISFLR